MRAVYTVWSNSDPVEGRGANILRGVYDSHETALFSMGPKDPWGHKIALNDNLSKVEQGEWYYDSFEIKRYTVMDLADVMERNTKNAKIAALKEELAALEGK